MKISMKDGLTVLEGTPCELAEYLFQIQGKKAISIVDIAEQMFKGGSGNATNRTEY